MIIDCPNKNKIFPYKVFNFPRGEMHLQLCETFEHFKVDIRFNFEKNEDIFELLLLADTLKRNSIIIDHLIIPFMPFAQADRVNQIGECFSLKLFCDLINNVVKPANVIVHDPHSDVTAALLNNCTVKPQWEILSPIIKNLYTNTKKSFVLVCPDAGAEKKCNKLASILDVDIVYCRKIRSTKDGTITGIYVDSLNLFGMDAIIVDDICVGGKTFIEIANRLRNRNCGKIILITTHGIYSNGIGIFDNLIDEIWNQYGIIKS